MTYTIFANRIDELQKAFNKYVKKANAIGLEASMTIGTPYPKKVNVYENDHINHITRKTGTTVIEVADVEINFPEYKLGNYTVIAVLEHNDTENNMVYPCGDVEVPKRYFTAKGICEHCGTNHKRVKTIVLKDTNDNYKQVGKACLKEYTGVDDTDIVKAYVAITAITMEGNADNGWFGAVSTNNKYTTTIDYLAKCVHYINNKGYVKDVTKYEACEIKTEDITTEDYKNAETVINYFTNIETDNTFINNIKAALSHEYTNKVNGFIAYAYVAYQKEIEKAKVNEANATVEYYGTVGQKFKDIAVTGRVIAGYGTAYGWTNIIEFKDNNNHIYIWKTTNGIEVDNNGNWTGTISGTIKEHTEYKGTKQTIVTRVKCA